MTAYYNEHNKYAAAWLRNLIAENLVAPGDVDERDIQEVKADDLKGYTQCHFFAGIGGWSYALRLAGWPDDRAVWTASLPCQPFSAAGEHQGTSDPRDLWPIYYRLHRHHRPPDSFGEQVTRAIRWGWLDRLCDDLEAIGNAVGAAVLPALCVGAWHLRERLWWVASDPTSIRGSGLVAPGNTRKPGPWWPRGETDLQAVIDRPFAPGTAWPQPLLRAVDDGLSERVGGCHAAGNAIVPELAAEFIRAWMDCKVSRPSSGEERKV